MINLRLGCLCGLLVITLMGCVRHHQGPMPGEPPDASFVVVDGVRMHYRDVGAGPPVVLIHGFASSLNNWAAVAPALEGERRVISMDLMGFGWSDRPDADYSPQGQAELVLGLLDARGVKRFDLVAHSWGSSVALAIALAAPARVRRIVLYDAWVYVEQIPTFFAWARAPGLGEMLMALFYKERPGDKMADAFYDYETYVTEEFVEHVSEQLDRPGTLAGALGAIRGHRGFPDNEVLYPTIQQPVLLLWGREDLVTPLWVGERLVRELPKAELVIYSRCGHFPMIEAFEASTAALRAFINQDLDALASSQGE